MVMAIKSGVNEWKLRLAVSTTDSEMFFVRYFFSS